MQGGGVLGAGPQALELGMGEGVEAAQEVGGPGIDLEVVAREPVGIEAGQARGRAHRGDRRAVLAAAGRLDDELRALDPHTTAVGKRGGAEAAGRGLQRDLAAGGPHPRRREHVLGDGVQRVAGACQVRGSGGQAHDDPVSPVPPRPRDQAAHP